MLEKAFWKLFGMRLPCPCSEDDLPVEDDLDTAGGIGRCVQETVEEIRLRIGDFHVDRFLGTGNDDRFW